MLLFTSGGLGLGLVTLVLVLRIWSCLHHLNLGVGQWLPFASRHAGEFCVFRRQALVVTFCLNSHNSRMPYEFSIRLSITKFIFVEKDSVFVFVLGLLHWIELF